MPPAVAWVTPRPSSQRGRRPIPSKWLPDNACAVYRPSRRPRAPFERVWGAQAFAIQWPSDVEQVCNQPGPSPANDPMPAHLPELDRGRAAATFDQMAQSIASYEASATSAICKMRWRASCRRSSTASCKGGTGRVSTRLSLIRANRWPGSAPQAPGHAVARDHALPFPAKKRVRLIVPSRGLFLVPGTPLRWGFFNAWGPPTEVAPTLIGSKFLEKKRVIQIKNPAEWTRRGLARAHPPRTREK